MIIQRNVEPKIAVSEEELQEEYEKRKDTDFTQPATVTLKEIAIPDEAGGLRLAQEIVERARAREDFASLARTHSASPTAESGGDLGEIVQGDMSPQLQEVAFSLSVGEVSDPIRIGDGYRILKLVARTDESVVPYATAKNQLRNMIMASRFEDAYEAFMAELREGQDIELRVREVPLRLSGQVPDETLFEDVDPFSMMSPGAGPAAAGAAPPAGPAPSSSRYGSPVGGEDEISTTPQARPDRIVPGSIMDDEISTTPQAAPERVAPGEGPAEDPPEAAPPPE
jgi:hypothetical protein